MSESEYRAGTKTVEELLKLDSVAYEIPIYQRSYSWKTQQIMQLMSDLYDTPEWAEENPAPYFLGSIVLASSIDTSRSVTYSVLDGQQRLTTLSLLLAVLRDKIVMEFPSEDAAAATIAQHLEFGRIGQPKKPKIRLQERDSQLFHELIKNPRVARGSNKKHNLVVALEKLTAEVDRILHGARAKGITQPLTKMAARLLYNVQMVEIVAPDVSRAFQLFETLNDRGLDLTAADLVKNKLFSQAGTYLEPVKERWLETVENLEGLGLVDYLRYYWIAFHGEARKNQLYDSYATHLNKLTPRQVEEFSTKLSTCSTYYRDLAMPDPVHCRWGAETGERLRRLDVYRAKSCRPALLAVAYRNDDDVPMMVEACESVTVRYSIVCDRNPNQLERAYWEICSILREHSGIPADQLIRPLFRIVPTDIDFSSAFAALHIETVSPTWREILIRLNDAVSTGETKITNTSKVHVEHIFPQQPSSEAMAEASIPPDEIDSAIHRIGNLTLLSARFNKSISNGPFSKKKPVLEKSEIAMTKVVGTSLKWTLEEIAARSEQFAQQAILLWPLLNADTQ